MVVGLVLMVEVGRLIYTREMGAALLLDCPLYNLGGDDVSRGWVSWLWLLVS